MRTSNNSERLRVCCSQTTCWWDWWKVFQVNIRECEDRQCAGTKMGDVNMKSTNADGNHIGTKSSVMYSMLYRKSLHWSRTPLCLVRCYVRSSVRRMSMKHRQRHIHSRPLRSSRSMVCSEMAIGRSRPRTDPIPSVSVGNTGSVGTFTF